MWKIPNQSIAERLVNRKINYRGALEIKKRAKMKNLKFWKLKLRKRETRFNFVIMIHLFSVLQKLRQKT